MLRDEMILEICGYWKSKHITAEHIAGKILALIAPELEKAKLWDRLCTITNPAHLYALAEWIDLKYPNDSDPEVQTELRKMGDIMAGNVVDALEGERK